MKAKAASMKRPLKSEKKAPPKRGESGKSMSHDEKYDSLMSRIHGDPNV